MSPILNGGPETPRYAGRVASDPSSPADLPGRPGHWVLSLVCRDEPGIVHAVSGAIVAAGGNITESQQFSSADTGRRSAIRNEIRDSCRMSFSVSFAMRVFSPSGRLEAG